MAAACISTTRPQPSQSIVPIIAGNSAPIERDYNGNNAFTITGSKNLIGAIEGTTITWSGSNLTGTSASPLDPLLANLTENGGQTPTLPPRAGSPVINQGSNVLGLNFDQRGAGFSRSIGVTDIGAVEGVPDTPVAGATLPAQYIAWATTYVATITYDDPSGIDVASIDTQDVTMSGPGLTSPITPFAATYTVTGTKVTATYTFTAPGGQWDTADDGKYFVVQRANQVFDLDAPSQRSAPAGVIGSFTALLPKVYVVDNASTTDDKKYGVGQLCLNEAIVFGERQSLARRYDHFQCRRIRVGHGKPRPPDRAASHQFLDRVRAVDPADNSIPEQLILPLGKFSHPDNRSFDSFAIQIFDQPRQRHFDDRRNGLVRLRDHSRRLGQFRRRRNQRFGVDRDGAGQLADHRQRENRHLSARRVP